MRFLFDSNLKSSEEFVSNPELAHTLPYVCLPVFLSSLLSVAKKQTENKIERA